MQWACEACPTRADCQLPGTAWSSITPLNGWSGPDADWLFQVCAPDSDCAALRRADARSETLPHSRTLELLQCRQCGSNMYRADGKECLPCPLHAAPNSDGSKCLCGVGYFDQLRDASDQASPQLSCQSRPEGADCFSAGLTTSTLQAAPCFWRASNASSHFVRCLIKAHCDGTQRRCLSDVSDADSSLGSRSMPGDALRGCPRSIAVLVPGADAEGVVHIPAGS